LAGQSGNFTIKSLEVGTDSGEFVWLFSKLPNTHLNALHALFCGVQTPRVRLFAPVNPSRRANEQHSGVEQAEYEALG